MKWTSRVVEEIKFSLVWGQAVIMGVGSERIPQGVNGQKTVAPAPNQAGDDLSGIEVQNSTDAAESSASLYTGKVADPHQMGCFLVKPRPCKPGRACFLRVSYP